MKKEHEEARADLEEAKRQLESERNRAEAIREARLAIPEDEDVVWDGGGRGIISGNPAVARGSLQSEPVYRPDSRVTSFFKDVIRSGQDPMAMERLARNQQEALDALPRETRDVTTSTGGFVPPAYLGELYAEKARPARPFAEAIGSLPLVESGTQISVPKVNTGVSVASQASENAALSKTDLAASNVTGNVNVIAGYNDLSIQALERTMPGLDLVIFQDLRAAYDSELDRQLLVGLGSGGEHLGISGVSSINSVTFTAST